jgi:prohibitin 2
MLKKAFKPAIAAVIALIIIFFTFGVVQPGYVGVLTTFGMVSENVKTEGIYAIIPFVQSVKQLDVRTKKIEWIKNEESITAMSKDMLDIYVQAVVTYHPNALKMPFIYKTQGFDYERNLVAPLSENIIKTYIGKYTVSDVIEKREIITEDMKNNLKENLLQYDLILDFITLINIDFRPGLKTAIEQREIAKKQVDTQKYTLEKQALEAQENVKKAEAEKQSKILLAEGEEIFNRKIAVSLTPLLLEYKKMQCQEKAIEKWNGSYPQFVSGNQSIPLIQLPQQTEK